MHCLEDTVKRFGSPRRKRKEEDVHEDSDEELDAAQAHNNQLAHTLRVINQSQEIAAILRQSRFRQIKKSGNIRFDSAATQTMEFRLRFVLIFWLISMDKETDWVAVVSEMFLENTSSQGQLKLPATSWRYTVKLQSLVTVNAETNSIGSSGNQLTNAQNLLNSAISSCNSTDGHFALEEIILTKVQDLNYLQLMQSQEYIKATEAIRSTVTSSVQSTLHDASINDLRLVARQKRKKSSGTAPNKSGEKLQMQLSANGMNSVILVSAKGNPTSLKVLSSALPSAGQKSSMVRLSNNQDLMNLVNGSAVNALSGRPQANVKVDRHMQVTLDHHTLSEYASTLCRKIHDEIKVAQLLNAVEGVEHTILPCHVIRSLCPGATQNMSTYFRRRARNLRFLMSVMISILSHQKVTIQVADKKTQSEILSIPSKCGLSEFCLSVWAVVQPCMEEIDSAATGEQSRNVNVPQSQHDVCSNQNWKNWAEQMRTIFDSKSSLTSAIWPDLEQDTASHNNSHLSPPHMSENRRRNEEERARKRREGKGGESDSQGTYMGARMRSPDPSADVVEYAIQNAKRHKSQNALLNVSKLKIFRILSTVESGVESLEKLRTAPVEGSAELQTEVDDVSLLDALKTTMQNQGILHTSIAEYVQMLTTLEISTFAHLGNVFARGWLEDESITSPLPVELRLALVSLWLPHYNAKKIHVSETFAKHLCIHANDSIADIWQILSVNDRVSNPALHSLALPQFREQLMLNLPLRARVPNAERSRIQWDVEPMPPKEFWANSSMLAASQQIYSSILKQSYSHSTSLLGTSQVHMQTPRIVSDKRVNLLNTPDAIPGPFRMLESRSPRLTNTSTSLRAQQLVRKARENLATRFDEAK